MDNKKGKIATKIIDISNNETLFYCFSISVNKCSGSCNNINNPYAKLFIYRVKRDINMKVFNLMSRTNEARHINDIKLVNKSVD